MRALPRRNTTDDHTVTWRSNCPGFLPAPAPGDQPWGAVAASPSPAGTARFQVQNSAQETPFPKVRSRHLPSTPGPLSRQPGTGRAPGPRCAPGPAWGPCSPAVPGRRESGAGLSAPTGAPRRAASPASAGASGGAGAGGAGGAGAAGALRRAGCCWPGLCGARCGPGAAAWLGVGASAARRSRPGHLCAPAAPFNRTPHPAPSPRPCRSPPGAAPRRRAGPGAAGGARRASRYPERPSRPWRAGTPSAPAPERADRSRPPAPRRPGVRAGRA